MKIKTVAIAVITLTLVAGGAFASMGGGSGMMGANRGGGPGGGIGNGPGDGMMGGQHGLVVGADGTAYLTRHLSTAADGQFDVIAVRPSGVVGWSYTLTTLGGAEIELAGTNVVVVQHVQPATAGASPVSKLTALSQSSGGVAWTLDIDGGIGDVESSNGVLYLTVGKVTVDTTSNTTAATHNLVAVSADGKIIYTFSLN